MHRYIPIFLLLLVASEATAQEFSRGVRPSGMGEANVALASGSSSIYQNPAGVARAIMYAIEGGYHYTPTGNLLSVAVADSKINPSLTAGVGYSYYFARDSDRTGHDLRVVLAAPVVPDRIALGVGGRYILLYDDEEKMLGAFTLDAGTVVRVSDEIALGIAGRNLIDICKEPEICQGVAPTVITGGGAFSMDALSLTADVGIDLNTGDDVAVDFGVGAEYAFQRVVPVRAGFLRKGAEERNILTFGGGWRSAAAGFDIAYQLDLTDTSRMFFMGSVSIYI